MCPCDGRDSTATRPLLPYFDRYNPISTQALDILAFWGGVKSYFFSVPDTYEQRVATGLRGLQLRHSCTYTRANPPTVPQPEGCAGSTGAARTFHAYPVNSCRGAPGGSWRHHRLENKLALMITRVPQPHVPRRENAIAAVAGSKRPHLTPRLHRDVCFFSSRSKFFRSRDGWSELVGTSSGRPTADEKRTCAAR